MEYTYDQATSDLYIRRSAKLVTRTEEYSSNCFVDLDSNNEVVGLEVIGLGAGWPSEEFLIKFDLQQDSHLIFDLLRSLEQVTTSRSVSTLTLDEVTDNEGVPAFSSW